MLLTHSMKLTVWLAAAFALLISSCSINKNLMFKTDDDFAFDTLNLDSSRYEYLISPDDILAIEIYTNEGSMILEFTTSAINRPVNLSRPDITYVVDKTGYVELPGIGRQNVAGMTIREAQKFLEEAYVFQFNKPFCIIRVINRRVLVFSGSGSEGLVVPLLNPNVSVIEALALSGGIRERGNASKVKLIRSQNEGKDEVYIMDLSTIEGIQYASMPVQAGDIIYVEPTPQVPTEILKDAQPFFQLITGLGVIYAIITR